MKLEHMSLASGMLGFALLIAGIALISVPVALIVAGILLLGYSLLLDKAAAAAHRFPPSVDVEKG